MPSSTGSSKPDPLKNQWVVVQLSSNGEHEKSLDHIVRAVHRILKVPLNVFIPAISEKVREDMQTMFYMDGYIFVEFRPGINYNKLNATNYFELVLKSNRENYALLSDDKIRPLKSGTDALKIGSFAKGDKVKVLKGTFKNLTGIISAVYDNGDKVQLNLQLSSKPVLMDYPSSYVVKIP